MNSRGYILLESLVASGLTLMILTVAATQLFLFWQMWHTSNEQARQRQWTTAAYDYLAADVREASGVTVWPDRLIFFRDDGGATYRLTSAGSFYRNWQNRNYALADRVESVKWTLEDEILTITLTYTDGQQFQGSFWVSQ